MTAIGVLEAARERGVVVGKELAVTGFDGIEEAAYSLPPLTTLSQSVYQIGQKMVKILLGVINQGPLEAPCYSVDPQLVVRESTGG